MYKDQWGNFLIAVRREKVNDSNRYYVWLLIVDDTVAIQFPHAREFDTQEQANDRIINNKSTFIKNVSEEVKSLMKLV